MSRLDLTFASGEASLAVRRFSVREAISTPFQIEIQAGSPRPDMDLDAIVGATAAFRLETGMLHAKSGGVRRWTGVCSTIERVHALPEGKGESTYALRIVPSLWLLTQRRNHRIFQHLSAPEIAKKLLAEWNVAHVFRIDPGLYPRLEYRVQYGETDFAFLSRMLEEAGIAYTFDEDGERGSILVLDDKAHAVTTRGAIWHEDEPTQAAEKDFVTAVQITHEIRSGAMLIRDFDFRRPAFPLFGAAQQTAPENNHEQYHYLPGSFLVEQASGGDTPAADDQGVARHSAAAGAALAERLLLGESASKRRVKHRTNVVDLRPGVVFSIANHPGGEVDERRLLAIELSIEGTPTTEWTTQGAAVFADSPYRPASRTPKPQIHSVQNAVVTGPAGQEIYTDEFGRVRVQFPWDREGRGDERSSCWMRVSHGSAGGSFGMIVLPRIGQEVLVGFLDGNPDQPIVVGRVFNATSPAPYKLPEGKTVSAWKGNSSPGGDGYNEIKFDDAAGGELLSVQAQKDLAKIVKNDEHETTLRDRSIAVKQHYRKDVEGDHHEQTGCDHKLAVGGAHTTNVGGAHTTNVGGAHALIIGGGATTNVEGSASHATAADSSHYVGGSRSAEVSGSDTIGAATFTVAVGKDGVTSMAMQPQKITITTGQATITLDGPNITLEAAASVTISAKDRVTINGKAVEINGLTVDVAGAGPVTVKGSVIDLNP